MFGKLTYLSKQAHLEAKPFIKASFALYDQLTIPVEGKHATGKGQLSTVRQEPLEDDISEHEIEQIPQSDLHYITNENDLSSSDDMPMDTPERNKCQPVVKLIPHHGKKVRSSPVSRITTTVENLVRADMLTSQILQKPIENEEFSYKKCLIELQQLEGLNQSERVQAIDLLVNEKVAIAFMTLEEELRLDWLRSKYHRVEYTSILCF
ncbi:hypothetical protein AMTR_s00042p00126630 [Amborella trichopoda]|uniref:Uncharacterized protein n=1 Tax=Amborella trichopoda TaxID=13333 RepID=W1P7L2_AMBTC|nr:hypothetical protein AMTR_s00042p00126630 [Amborella trichopoda]